MTVATVRLWGRTIGAVSWNDDRDSAHFEYDPAFVSGGPQVAPLTMPLSGDIHSFPALPRQTFHGLPGLLADSLPDRFGHALIDAWLARQGRDPGDFNPVERLCYVGTRGMGALEFLPAHGPTPRSAPVDVAALVELASEILTERTALEGSLAPPGREQALQDILRVGTSAGGARAKAVIAWNPATNEVRSGAVKAGDGFSHWLLKFDGVAGNRDRELEDPQGYGLIEHAYHAMARAAGIDMTECRILRENNRHHFMTRRFDRTDTGGKIHMQSLGALAHYDFNQPGAYSYEQALRVIERLGLGKDAAEEQFRRMAFNIVARNQDDHVKNIAFLMDRSGRWRLSPAFDVTYSYNPEGRWTGAHQMTLNGKRDGFEIGDFVVCARNASLKRGRAAAILRDVQEAVSRWPEFAEAAGVPADAIRRIRAVHRTGLLP
ncbi:MAG: type II toxin-antitoxin system HipA family toxin [Acidobacteriota bacterium]|nr:type II toxin-antitoxin system HipA family toxin [Acidobacteriota bacterium]